MTCSVEGCKCKVAYRGLCQQHHRSLLRSGQIKPLQQKPGEPLAFLKRSLLQETDDCILWPYGVSNTYGTVILDGVRMSSARAVCFLAYGKSDLDRPVAAHSCDVRLCVNKRHLRWATYQDNANDRLAHGVVHRGKAAGSRFTAEQVMQIFHDPRPHVDLAREYDCSDTTIYNIKRGISWGWLTQCKDAA